MSSAPAREALALTVADVVDAVADRLAARLLAAIETRDPSAMDPDAMRALKFAAIDVATMANLLDVAGDDPRLERIKKIAARVVEALAQVTQ